MLGGWIFQVKFPWFPVWRLNNTTSLSDYLHTGLRPDAEAFTEGEMDPMISLGIMNWDPTTEGLQTSVVTCLRRSGAPVPLQRLILHMGLH